MTTPLILICHPALQLYKLGQLSHHLICHYKCYDHIRHSCYKDSHVFQVFMTKIISIIQIMCSMTVKIARVSSNQQIFIFSESEGIAERKRSHFHMLWVQWCSDRQRRRHNVTQSGSDGLSPTQPRSSREMTLPYTNTSWYLAAFVFPSLTHPPLPSLPIAVTADICVTKELIGEH